MKHLFYKGWKGGYWGHKDGTPVSFEELMSDPYGGYA
jgi:hypothetical protein